MKGFLALLLAWSLALSTKAQFNYTTTNGSVTITGYTGSGGTITIPDTLSVYAMDDQGNCSKTNNVVFFDVQ